MSRWWPIGQKRMIECEAKFADGFGTKISLFPFFDGDGVVLECLLFDAALGEVRWMDDSRPIKIPLVGPIVFPTGWQELPEFDSLHVIDQTWHYDPQWSLALPSFKNHPMMEVIRKTNCAEQFDFVVKNVFFDAQMQRVKWVLKHTPNAGSSLITFKPSHLPDAPVLGTVDASQTPSDANAAPRRHWVLSPIWER